MNELALFAGVGGGLLGSHLLGWRCVCAVEVEPFCREIMLRRQRDGVFPVFPIWDDIRSFDGRPWRGIVDVVTAGFPCQPFSVAGKRQGEDDERNLWPETIRIIREVGPRFALLENVPGLLAHRYFGTILGDLAESGYNARWRVLSAAEVGAPHRRDRLWILADAERERLEGSWERHAGARAATPASSWWHTDPADVGDAEGGTERAGLCETHQREEWRGRSSDASRRPTLPRLDRVAHGVPHRTHRLRAIGNAQVPGVVRAAWELLKEKP